MCNAPWGINCWSVIPAQVGLYLSDAQIYTCACLIKDSYICLLINILQNQNKQNKDAVWVSA